MDDPQLVSLSQKSIREVSANIWLINLYRSGVAKTIYHNWYLIGFPSRKRGTLPCSLLPFKAFLILLNGRGWPWVRWIMFQVCVCRWTRVGAETQLASSAFKIYRRELVRPSISGAGSVLSCPLFFNTHFSADKDGVQAASRGFDADTLWLVNVK